MGSLDHLIKDEDIKIINIKFKIFHRSYRKIRPLVYRKILIKNLLTTSIINKGFIKYINNCNN